MKISIEELNKKTLKRNNLKNRINNYSDRFMRDYIQKQIDTLNGDIEYIKFALNGGHSEN